MLKGRQRVLEIILQKISVDKIEKINCKIAIHTAEIIKILGNFYLTIRWQNIN